jgi:predicted transposase/invertase (TIGR01784 family)
MIIPVIYYHGKTRWKFRPLHQLFNNIPASIHKYIPNFETEMLRVQEYSIPQIHNIAEAKLRAAFLAQRGLHDKMVAIQDYVRVINTLGSYGPGNFLKTFFVYISNIPTFDKEKFIDITNQLTTDMRNKSMTLYDQLIAEGKEEGIIIGIEQGIEKGSIQKCYEFARKLIQRNMPIEDICELTSLSREEVQALM